MKNRTGILLLLCAISFSFLCCNSKKKEETAKESVIVSRFSWLNGNWVMPGDEATITESWKTINDTLMEGRSDFVKGDSVIPSETIRLYQRQGDLYYEPTTAGQNDAMPVAFKLTSFSDTSFVAENPEHDFPKRISYTLVNKDSIHAFIDGGPSASSGKSDFYYSRTKN